MRRAADEKAEIAMIRQDIVEKRAAELAMWFEKKASSTMAPSVSHRALFFFIGSETSHIRRSGIAKLQLFELLEVIYYNFK